MYLLQINLFNYSVQIAQLLLSFHFLQTDISARLLLLVEVEVAHVPPDHHVTWEKKRKLVRVNIKGVNNNSQNTIFGSRRFLHVESAKYCEILLTPSVDTLDYLQSVERRMAAAVTQLRRWRRRSVSYSWQLVTSPHTAPHTTHVLSATRTRGTRLDTSPAASLPMRAPYTSGEGKSANSESAEMRIVMLAALSCGWRGAE